MFHVISVYIFAAWLICAPLAHAVQRHAPQPQTVKVSAPIPYPPRPPRHTPPPTPKPPKPTPKPTPAKPPVWRI